MFKKIIIAALAFASAANGVRVELATQCRMTGGLGCVNDSECCSNFCHRFEMDFGWRTSTLGICLDE